MMSLRELYDERKPLYEQYADVTVDAEQEQAGDVMNLILEQKLE